MVAIIHKEFHDATTYNVVTLHSVTGDVTIPCEIVDATTFYACVTFSNHQFDYGMYGPHKFYSNNVSTFDEAPSNHSIIEPNATY